MKITQRKSKSLRTIVLVCFLISHFQVAGEVCAEENIHLAPSLRTKPIVELREQDGRFVVDDAGVMAERENGEAFTRVSARRALDRIIFLVIEKRLLAGGLIDRGGLTDLIETYFSDILGRGSERYRDIISVFRWDHLKTEGDRIRIPYSPGLYPEGKELVYSIRDGIPSCEIEPANGEPLIFERAFTYNGKHDIAGVDINDILVSVRDILEEEHGHIVDISTDVRITSPAAVWSSSHVLPPGEESGSQLEARANLMDLIRMVLANALYYRDHREDYHVDVGSSLSADGKITLFIEDNGPGLDLLYFKGDPGRVFWPSSTAKKDQKYLRLMGNDEPSGRGMGLAVVNRIVMNSGGALRLVTRPGKGTRFEFTFRPYRDAGEGPAVALRYDEGSGSWERFAFTSEQHMVLNGVLGPLRKGNIVKRTSEIYELLDTYGDMRGMRSGGKKGVSLVVIPDGELYSRIKAEAYRAGISFPDKWVLLAHPGTWRDPENNDMPRSANLFMTKSVSEVLIEMGRRYKPLVGQFAEHEAEHIRDRIEGNIRPEEDMPGIEVFTEKFMEFYAGGMSFAMDAAEHIDHWDHQVEALGSLEAVRENGGESALIVHPTGSGKTVTAITDAVRTAASKGGSILYLAHSNKILRQAEETFGKFGKKCVKLPSGRVSPTAALRTYDAVVASCQYLAKNLDDFPANIFDYIIIDEAHHVANRTYQSITSHFDSSFLLGMTGTSLRYDGTDVSIFFDEVADRKSIGELVSAGRLAPVRALRVKTGVNPGYIETAGDDFNADVVERIMNTRERNELVVDTYIRQAEKVKDLAARKGRKKNNVPAVAFGVTVKHAEALAARFNERGIPSACVSGKMRQSEIDSVLRDYERGKIKVITSCQLLGEGWDAPSTEMVLMARPTRSPVTYLQQMGRGLRTHEDKDALWVVDFVDNMENVQTACSLHGLFRIPVYKPGQYVFGAGPQDEQSLPGIEIQSEEEVALFEPLSWLTIAEAARRIGSTTSVLKRAMEKGYLKAVPEKVEYTNAKGVAREKIFFHERELERLDRSVAEMTDAEIPRAISRKRTKIVGALSETASGRAALGVYMELDYLAKVRPRYVLHRDEEILGLLTDLLSVSHEIDKRASDLLLRIEGPMVMDILRERYFAEGTSERARTHIAAIMALRGERLSGYHDLLLEGLRSSQYYVSVLSAKALYHVAERYVNSPLNINEVKDEVRDAIDATVSAALREPAFRKVRGVFEFGADMVVTAEPYEKIQYLLAEISRHEPDMEFIVPYYPVLEKIALDHDETAGKTYGSTMNGYEYDAEKDLIKAAGKDPRIGKCENMDELMERLKVLAERERTGSDKTPGYLAAEGFMEELISRAVIKKAADPSGKIVIGIDRGWMTGRGGLAESEISSLISSVSTRLEKRLKKEGIDNIHVIASQGDDLTGDISHIVEDEGVSYEDVIMLVGEEMFVSENFGKMISEAGTGSPFVAVVEQDGIEAARSRKKAGEDVYLCFLEMLTLAIRMGCGGSYEEDHHIEARKYGGDKRRVYLFIPRAEAFSAEKIKERYSMQRETVLTAA